MSESYILTEGYHDRAFWAGQLIHLGCDDPGVRPNGRRAAVTDPFGVPVGAGQFAFNSLSGGFIRIVPAKGKERIPELLRMRLKEREIKRLTRLVVNVDSDENADGSPPTGTSLTSAQLLTIVREFEDTAGVNADGDIEIDGGQTHISLVPWQVDDPPDTGLPHQHTLERLICASVAAAFPNRPTPVQNWLDSRPAAPPAGPKEYAWSYLAGWHADVGSYEGFCSMLWNNQQIRDCLIPRLEQTGQWRVAEALAA